MTATIHPMPAALQVLVYEQLSTGVAVPGLDRRGQAELLAQGRAMRDAMLADLCALPHVAVACAVAADGTPSASLPRRVRAVPFSGSHAAALAAAARQGSLVWAVAPETGGDLETLARAVPDAQWLGSTPAAIALAASKTRCREHLAAAGLRVPDPRRDGQSGWVVKPDDGAGATETRRHPHHEAAAADAANRRARGQAVALEPWVDGEALSVSLCCTRGAVEVLAVNRQQIDVDAQGFVHFHGVTAAAFDPAVEPGRSVAAAAQAAAQAVPGLRGYVGVDLVWRRGQEPVLIEINPRLTTAYAGLSERLRFNVAGRLLGALNGFDPNQPPAS